ncbi:transglycosylase SLT domain-containing protein [Rhizobium sp. TRM95796]|uniref:transglycosylase SLT domain-containing protein n=1 Tax=Rhizobium sp. TRM95796 TaxID=2979862 RepID=UPI0021E79576|nr:transglycosylase SLT domain-containing protein [Rhizobium sp. TRM95796]MCV3766253.1 transglycosylase SLT domain-containing protein [Rhizobium sp. TRM95796]
MSLTAAALAILATVSTSDARASSGLCEREISRAAARYGVPEGILYSVGLTETGRKGSLQPWALNIEGKAVFARSPDEALEAFRDARARGAELIDLGCMQINQRYHGDQFSSLDAMLDPEKNVDYAARFLAQLHAKHVTWTMAVARYHAGPNNNPAQKRYVCRVISNLVATGYGVWTPKALDFCSN